MKRDIQSNSSHTPIKPAMPGLLRGDRHSAGSKVSRVESEIWTNEDSQISDKRVIQCEERTDTFVADSPLYIIHEKNPSVPSVQSFKPSDTNIASLVM
jgi:hypothetical protein